MLAAQTGVAKPKPAIDELVVARLWDVTEGGYKAHDYLDYNTSAEKVRAKRDAAKERMQRLRSPDVRANNERSSRNVAEPTTETTTTSSIEPNGSQELESLATPPKRLPEHGDAQTIVARFCEAAGIEKPANYPRAVGIAKQIAAAGVGPDEIAALYVFTASRWRGTADLGKMLGAIDEFRAKPVPPPGFVDPDEAIRAWKNGGAAEPPQQIRPFARGAAS